MTDPNRPIDPSQQNPQVPSSGTPYGPPGGYQAPGQPNYGQSGQSGYGPVPDQGLGQQPPAYGQQQPAYGQQPPEYGQQQPAYGQQPPVGGFTAPGVGAQPSGQFGAVGGQQPPAGWGAGPVQPGQPKPSGSKTPLLIGGAAVLIVALIVGAMQLFNRTATPTTDDPRSTSPTASASTGVGAGSATEVVQKYFDGLAASDPEAIFALVRDDLPDRTFLTKDVLTAATQAAPITNLKLTELESSKYSAEVQASYTINSRTQTQKFYVSARDNAWYLTTITGRIYVKVLSPGDTGLTVNGLAVPQDADSIDVFPGGYTLATASEDFDLSDDEVIVENLGSGDVFDIDVKLSDSALASFKAATTKLINSCKRPGALVKPACGINFKQPSGDRAVVSTIACTPSGTNSINRMKPRLDMSDLSVQASVSIRWKCTMKGRSGDPYTGTGYLFSVYGQKSGSGWTATGQRP